MEKVSGENVVGENLRDETSIILYKMSSRRIHVESAPDFCRMC